MNRLRLKLAVLACLAAIPLFLSGIGLNSASFAAQKTTQAEEAPQEKPRKPPRGRVPAGFGKIGVSENQKEEIYAIQARYKAQVEDLLAQLEELKSQEAEEIHNVLTDDQKLALKKYRDEAAAKRKTQTKPSE
ncbi:MAG TPA: hypothetical protein VLA12_03120 [Planctomycetaceae bacterium]|nr:hypothetical protein [Planctomycetaceae bacterium]